MLGISVIKCIFTILIIMVTHKISCLHNRGYCLLSAAHGVAGLGDESLFRCAIRAISPSTVTYAINDQIRKLMVHIDALMQCFRMLLLEKSYSGCALNACSAKH